jgi:cellulose synthase (UDP-forming)
MRRLLILVTAGLGLYYLIYRALYTLNPDQAVFSLLFYAAEVHGYLALILFLFDMWSPVRPVPPAAPPGLSVDVFIPTYNEDVGLLRRTVLGANAIRYPHTTYLLDDGNRAEVRALAGELGVQYIAREEHHHAKAGNINHALRQTRGDFIALFDADHVPQPQFLDRTLGFFADPRMAFIQTPQFFYNLSAFEEFSHTDTDEHWEQQSMFFHYLQPGKQRWNAAFFCGTCAVIRRKALEEVGGIATDTITEDIHTSVLIHARGWKSVYLDEHLATGLAPTDVVSYFKQRLRWALGNLRVMFICNPLVRRGLTLPQRLSYFSSMFSWTIGFQKVIYYVTPPLMLLTPLMPIDRFFTNLVGLYAANLLLQLFTYKALTGGRGRIFMDELFNMLNFGFLIRSFFRAMFGLGQRFVVTRKTGGEAAIPLVVVWPQLALVLLAASGLAWWVLKILHGINLDLLSSAIAAFWTAYVLALAGAAIARALRKYDVRSDYRFRESIPIWYRGADQSWRPAVTVDFNTQGLWLLAYEPLPMDRPLALRLMLDAGPLEAQARLLYRKPSENLPDIHSYGAQFVDLTAADRDRLNAQAIGRTVPQLMARIYRRRSGWRELLRGFLPYRRRRYPAWKGLPLSTSDQPGEWAHARVQDVRQREITLLAATSAEVQQTLPFVLLSPFGVVRGTMRVLAASELPGAGTWEWRVYLETLSPDNAARYERLLRNGEP